MIHGKSNNFSSLLKSTCNNSFVLYFIFFVFLNFYICLVTSCSYDFHFKDFSLGGYISYNHLVDALLHKQLHLLNEPHPELILLSDPYDPILNGPYRWHDVTYYKGKYYLYFGITPVILFYLPYKLIIGNYLPCPFVNLIFVFGTFVFGSLFLAGLHRKHFQAVPKWILYLCICVFGLSNMGPALMDGDTFDVGVYNVSTAGGMFFITGAIYFLTRALYVSPPNFKMLCVGSLFLALAFGCRPHYALCSILLLILFAKLYKKKTELSFKLKLIFSLFLPYATFASVVGIYNFFRFGNPFEFGFKYQLNYFRPKVPDFSSIIPNLYCYLFMPVTINKEFPFFHRMIGHGIPDSIPVPSHYLIEDMVGSITSVPFLLTPFVYWLYLLFANRKLLSAQIFRYFELIILLISSFISFLFLLLMSGTNTRYLADFQGQFILAASIAWFYFCSITSFYNSAGKKTVTVIIVLFATVSMLCGMAFGISGYRNIFSRKNPVAYEKIKYVFYPVSYFANSIDSFINIPIGEAGTLILKPVISLHSFTSSLVKSSEFIMTKVFEKKVLEPVYRLKNNKSILGQILIKDQGRTIYWFNGEFWLPIKDDEKKYRSITSYGSIKMTVKFDNPTSSPELREPLLTTGKSGNGDLVYVEYKTANKLIFGLDVWGSGGPRSRSINIDPNKVYTLEIAIGSLYPNFELNKEKLKSVVIKLNDKIVLDAMAKFHETNEEDILVGKNKIGGSFQLDRFSGEVIDIARLDRKI